MNNVMTNPLNYLCNDGMITCKVCNKQIDNIIDSPDGDIMDLLTQNLVTQQDVVCLLMFYCQILQ